jgi:hypothetical protein
MDLIEYGNEFFKYILPLISHEEFYFRSVYD